MNIFWCVTCGVMETDVLKASAHQYPPVSHAEMRKIGTLP